MVSCRSFPLTCSQCKSFPKVCLDIDIDVVSNDSHPRHYRSLSFWLLAIYRQCEILQKLWGNHSTLRLWYPLIAGFWFVLNLNYRAQEMMGLVAQLLMHQRIVWQTRLLTSLLMSCWRHFRYEFDYTRISEADKGVYSCHSFLKTLYRLKSQEFHLLQVRKCNVFGGYKVIISHLSLENRQQRTCSL